MPRAKKKPAHYNAPIDHTLPPVAPTSTQVDRSIQPSSMKYTKHKDKMKPLTQERKFFFHSGLVTQLLNTKNFHKLTDNIFNPNSYDLYSLTNINNETITTIKCKLPQLQEDTGLSYLYNDSQFLFDTYNKIATQATTSNKSFRSVFKTVFTPRYLLNQYLTNVRCSYYNPEDFLSHLIIEPRLDHNPLYKLMLVVFAEEVAAYIAHCTVHHSGDRRTKPINFDYKSYKYVIDPVDHLQSTPKKKVYNYKGLTYQQIFSLERNKKLKIITEKSPLPDSEKKKQRALSLIRNTMLPINLLFEIDDTLNHDTTYQQYIQRLLYTNVSNLSFQWAQDYSGPSEEILPIGNYLRNPLLSIVMNTTKFSDTTENKLEPYLYRAIDLGGNNIDSKELNALGVPPVAVYVPGNPLSWRKTQSYNKPYVIDEKYIGQSGRYLWGTQDHICYRPSLIYTKKLHKHLKQNYSAIEGYFHSPVAHMFSSSKKTMHIKASYNLTQEMIKRYDCILEKDRKVVRPIGQLLCMFIELNHGETFVTHLQKEIVGDLIFESFKQKAQHALLKTRTEEKNKDLLATREEEVREELTPDEQRKITVRTRSQLYGDSFRIAIEDNEQYFNHSYNLSAARDKLFGLPGTVQVIPYYQHIMGSRTKRESIIYETESEIQDGDDAYYTNIDQIIENVFTPNIVASIAKKIEKYKLMHTMRQDFITRAISEHSIKSDTPGVRQAFINSVLAHLNSPSRYPNPFDTGNDEENLNRFEYTMTVRYVLRATPYIYSDYFIFTYNNDGTDQTEQTGTA